MKVPCEIIVWEILPVIRKEFAKTLIKQHGFTQRKTAETLGLTEATVSRYVSGKRGKIIKLNKKMIKEIQNSSAKISKGDTQVVIEETCKICNMLKSQGFLEGVTTGCK